MVFNDTSASKTGLIQECEFLLFGDQGYGKISGTTTLLATFTRLINHGLNSAASLIMQADNRWQFDDTNQTDFPIGTTTLTASQADYALAVTHVRIERVEVKDEEGNWHLLQPIDQSDVYDTSLTDFLKTAGLPRFYDKTANSLVLYPKPDYTQSASLKVYFQRPPSYFTTASTTAVPGFNSLYHRLVALYAARDYAVARGLKQKNDLAQLVLVEEQKLQDDYSLRNKDEKLGLKVRKYNFR